MGLTLIDAHLRELGASRTAAANEANSDVIAGCVWVDPCHPTKPLAPCCPKSPSVSNFCTLSTVFEGPSCGFATLGYKNCSRVAQHARDHVWITVFRCFHPDFMFG
ncbi:hypothetical protein B1A59_02220 [Corynebacterium diphtheriae]|nr:hypothetical protein B1A59_02220 [Corynebacterium diphtheriae]